MAESSKVSVEDIINRTKKRIEEEKLSPQWEKYRHLVLMEADNYTLNESQVRALASHLKIPFPGPPRGARGWKPSICKIYMSIKYTNPNDPREFIIKVSSSSPFGVNGVVHHTPYGYRDTSWFTNFVVNLDKFAADYEKALKRISPTLDAKKRIAQERRDFTANVNDPINSEFSKGMDQVQLKAIHAFFLKYLPDVEGLCKKCFQLSLPMSGPGARWFSDSLSLCEVRLSEAKPDGRPAQQKLYLTHNYTVGPDVLHVKWNGIFTDSPNFDTNVRQADTHIPWVVYDYETIVDRLPPIHTNKFSICQCRKT